MGPFKSFKSLPVNTKRLLSLGIIIALVVALPLFIWALVNLNFNQKEKAASGEPIDIAAGEPVIGLPDAQITIVAYTDFQCPYCKHFVDNTLSTILANYPDDVKFVFKDFPIESIHPLAKKAAVAGQCAFAQGKFWEMHDLIFANQATLSEVDLGSNFPTQLNLDIPTYASCYSGATASLALNEVQDDLTEGIFKGVVGTPTFFIGKTSNFDGGQQLDGSQPFANFEAVIESLLESSTASPTATGTSDPDATATATASPTAEPTDAPIGGPGEPNSCGGTCGSNYNCKANLYCYQGYCRNPICSTETDCDCSVAANKATTKPTVKSGTGGIVTKTATSKATLKGSPKPTPTYTSGMTLIDNPSELVRDEFEEETTAPENQFVAKYAMFLLGAFVLIVIGSIIYAVKKNRDSNIPRITPPTNI